MTVIDRDLGYAEVVELMKKLGDDDFPALFVGIRSDKGAEPVDGEGLTLAGLAAVHEYGDDESGIPERSFLRSTSDEHAGEYGDAIGEAVKAGLDRKGDVKKGLGRLGAKVVGDVQQKIADRIQPALKPETVAKKVAGRDTPLIDTGRLRQSIDFEVK